MNISALTGTDLILSQQVSTMHVNDDGEQVARPGAELIYTIQVENPVSVDATNVTLRAALDATARPLIDTISVNGSDPVGQEYRLTSNTLYIDVGTLPAGAATTVLYTVRLLQPFPADLQQVVNAVDIFYDFNTDIGGQAGVPLSERDSVEKCLVVSTQGVTSLDLMGEPTIADNVYLEVDQIVGATKPEMEPSIFIPLFR